MVHLSNFEEEIVVFDIINPIDFVYQGDVQLTIEVWHKGKLIEEPIATASVSILRFLRKPFSMITEIVAMLDPTNMSPIKSKVSIG